jgi:LuxR family maltose regulon positive regulatory protein
MPGATSYEHAAVLGGSSALPFVLGALPIIREESQIQTILNRLEVLQDVALASRREIDSLRQLNTEILQAVRTTLTSRAVALAPVADTAGASVDARPLRLQLFGTFEVQVRGRLISSWPSKKARLLLAYIAMERGRMVPKDMLIDLLWPDGPPERGSNNLSIAIHQIRATLSELDPVSAQAIIVRQGLYGLDQALVAVDLWEFQGHLSEARQALERHDDDATRAPLASAVDLCQAGDFLESDPYEDWTVEPRRSWSTAYNQALAWLATEASRGADWPRVIDYAGRILQRERCDEAGHRLLILAHWKTGNRPQALQQYRLCEAWLRDDLGVEPSEETRRLHALVEGRSRL